ncbi:CUB and sushi domain-containing protein 1-like [Corticium candelabrum]|uniref:CUB and sushi domain-containing protein 1-like n=1 Tax=Corticium candelabrum TaxID=121492 RepID=UPI002E277412|nr:CUB and sushi domain-containing protein 1-like [Corticium candelabrum]
MSLVFFCIALLMTSTASLDECSMQQCSSACSCNRYVQCGGKITGSSQKISLPAANGRYRKCVHCTWNIRVRQQDTVRLHFEQFDLGEGDWVKVYDGSKSKVSEIIRWDSYASPVDVVSSGHKMVVEFRSNACGEKSGIHAVMEINISICERPSSVANGKVRWTDFRRKAIHSCCPGYVTIGNNATQTCVGSRWTPSDTITCKRVTSCPQLLPPNNGIIVGGKSPPTHVGATVEFQCNLDYNFEKEASTVRAVCKCTREWQYTPVKPYCKLFQCGPLPPSPQPGGFVQVKSPLVLGTVATYKCSKRFGLDGIPTVVCQADGSWYPVRKSHHPHQCVANLTTCDDSCTPANGKQRVVSFAHSQFATFGCNDGYEQKDTHLRTCLKSNSGKTYWSGTPTVYRFKNPSQLAGQFREGFLNRTVKCNNNKNSSIDSSQSGSNATKSSNEGLCRGRSVVVGEGCVDLIFAIDCSKSISEHNFNLSLAFAARSVAMFDISAEKTTEETVEAIQSARYCGGATATGPVLKHIRTKILPQSKSDCKRAIFLLTDGKNNWAGDPSDEAEQLKNINGTEIYTIAYGDSDLNWDVLSRLASKKEYFFAVREPITLSSVVQPALLTAEHASLAVAIRPDELGRFLSRSTLVKMELG